MEWTITSFPKCGFHAFLSHSAEDRDWLVEPLCGRMAQNGIISWFDQRHYPVAVGPYEALRHGILQCRAVVYLITSASLGHSRGWQAIEKAYGGILQDCFVFPGIELSRVELPLFFIPRDHSVLGRSIWQPMVSKGGFHTPAHGDPLEWAMAMIDKFIRAQQTDATQMQQYIGSDPHLRDRVASRPGMADRIAAAYP